MPLLPVELHLPDGFVRITMLVDSGSEETLLPASVLVYFGVVLDPDAFQVAGVGGEVTGRRASIVLNVGGQRYETDVVVIDDEQLPIGLLGHRGFFEHFRVTFETNRNSFTVTPLES